ncbi:MAG: ribosome silencing factor [Steroidobacteraceae bacterium]
MKTARPSRARSAAPKKTPARKKTASRTSRSAQPALLGIVAHALDDMKAVDVKVLDVRGSSDVTDYMVIASGNSDRHVRSIADRVVQLAKASGQRPLGIEGEAQGEWVLVDLPDVMVHVMLPRTREFYQIEQLWDVPRRETAARPRAPRR